MLIDSPVGRGKERRYYRLIGVFRLCAGDDRLDVVPVCGVDAEFRGLLRGGAGLYSLAHHGGALLARPTTQRDGHSCIS